MPSNKELRGEIEKVAADLKIPAAELGELGNMGNQELGAVLTELRTRARDENPPEPADAKAPAAPKKKGPHIAKGKSITTKRGILGPGAPISAADLQGGGETFAKLVEAGYIDKGNA